MLLEMKPERIVYVSCLPKSLARDMKALSSEYMVGKISCFDMFPDTVHVESVVKLTRAGL
jgi:23S rRNA (uracil1939-C5)-methyltransferase